MATSLTEHLPIIEAAATTGQPGYLPDMVGEVRGEAREYARKVQDFLEHLAQKGAAADDLLDRVEKALRDLKAQAAQEQPEVEKALKDVGEELEKTLGVQETEEGQLASSVEAAGKAMDELREKLQEAGRRAHQAQEKAASGMTEVREGLTEAEGTMDTALEGVASGANEVEAQIASMTQKMGSALDALKAKMAEYHGYAESRMEDVAARLGKLAGVNASERREALESLVGKSTALWDAVKERLERQQQQVAEAMAQVGAAIGEVSAALSSAGTDAQNRCGELDDPAAMLAASVPYMNGLVDKVKEAAGSLTQVQVSWPH
jgi:ABC-type transporter Mla subunit MlaD